MFPSKTAVISGGASTGFTNTYSLAFDGSNDFVATSGDGTLADRTYMFWAKSTETGSNYGVFGHGSDTIGAFHLNVGNTPFLTIGGATNTRRFWTDVAAQDDGNWHHWAVYVDSTSIVNSKLYIDGDLQSPTSTNGTTTIAAYSSNLTIGGATGEFFEGSLDEFAVFSGDTTSKASDYWNSGTPTDLSGESGLLAYYRMGDGTEGASGTTIYDMSANSNNGTMTNMAGTFSTDVPT